MARTPYIPIKKRTSSRGEYINGKFVTYKELAEQINEGYNRVLKKRLMSSERDLLREQSRINGATGTSS